MSDKALAQQDAGSSLSERAWAVISSGNLKGLFPQERSIYYLDLCASMGLNPRTVPFEYITFQGKEILYAKKGATDQLRQIHGVSVTNVKLLQDDDYIAFGVSVQDATGRTDYDEGVVFVGNANGPDRANARKKALTQGKRRATLSLCGLSMLDESEISPDVGYPVMRVDVDTGEIVGNAPVAAIQGGRSDAGAKNNVRALPSTEGQKQGQKPTRDQMTTMFGEWDRLEWTADQRKAWLDETFGNPNVNALTTNDAERAIQILTQDLGDAEEGTDVTWDDTTGAPEGFTDAEWTELGGKS